MARERDRRKAAAERRRPVKKKVSILTVEGVDWVDYKDVNLLRRFMSERAKIRARRVTGNTAQQQRAVARAIRIAREMALLPYSVRQVTQRSKSPKRERAMVGPPPVPAAPPPTADSEPEPEGLGPAVADDTVGGGDTTAAAAPTPGGGGEEGSS
jgi:small subunit ribosomal protein S18